MKKVEIISKMSGLSGFFVLILSAFLVFSAVSPVFADTAGGFFSSGKQYIALKGGIYTPNSSDLKGFGTGFNGEVALGHYFNPFAAMELGLGYYQTSHSTSGTVTTGSDYLSGTAKLDLWTIPLTLAVKAIYPINRFELYALGGVGAYFSNAKLEYSGTAKVGGTTYNGTTSTNAGTTAFGGFLGGGVNFNFMSNWYIGAEGKYHWSRPSFKFDGTDVSAYLDGWTVTGNIGYKF